MSKNDDNDDDDDDNNDRVSRADPPQPLEGLSVAVHDPLRDVDDELRGDVHPAEGGEGAVEALVVATAVQTEHLNTVVDVDVMDVMGRWADGWMDG